MDRFSLESKAYESFSAWMQAGRECRAHFEQAGIPLPEPLRRFLGDVEPPQIEQPPAARVIIPAPEAPPAPPEWEKGWIWVPLSKMGVAGLVRGVLRSAGADAMSPSEIASALEEKGVDFHRGSIANLGTRLAESGEIERGRGAWRMKDMTRCPVLYGEHAWGPATVFDKHELAAHRRLGIVHLLKAHSDGMQTIQISRALESCDWLEAPATKDLVKMDLQELQKEQKVRRVGKTGKWRPTNGS